jgi:Excalibur calcium-binding domain
VKGQPRNARTAAIAALVALVVPVSTATGAVPAKWKNCTRVNARFHHGLGKVGAHDKTSGEPVTNFYRSTRLYRVAMSYNRGLDRDKDGIACEKH